MPRKAEYGPCKTKYSGFLRTPGLKITSRLLDQNPWVIKNLRVPMQSPGHEKISGPKKGKPPSSYITPDSKRTSGPEGTSGFPNRLRVPKRPPSSKQPPGPEGTSGFPNHLLVQREPPGSQTTSGFKTTFGSKRNLRVQKDLRVQRNLRVQKDLRVQKKPLGSKQPLGHSNLRVQNDLRVQKKPLGSKGSSGPKYDLRV